AGGAAYGPTGSPVRRNATYKLPGLITSASSRADRACLERAGRSQPANGRLRDAVGAGQLCLRGALREALHGLTALMGCERRRATEANGPVPSRGRGRRRFWRGYSASPFSISRPCGVVVSAQA